MDTEWSLNTPEMEENVDSPDTCGEDTSERTEFILHNDKIETPNSSSLNTPEVPTLGERQFSFPEFGEKPPEDIFQADGLNPRMTLRETMIEEKRWERPPENIQDFLVRCLFGDDMEASQVFSSRRGGGQYEAKEKLRVFFKHYPNFPLIIILILAMFCLFPMTVELVGLIIVAVVTSLCATVYQNVR